MSKFRVCESIELRYFFPSISAFTSSNESRETFNLWNIERAIIKTQFSPDECTLNIESFIGLLIITTHSSIEKSLTIRVDLEFI